jgi:hypothetical protein
MMKTNHQSGCTQFNFHFFIESKCKISLFSIYNSCRERVEGGAGGRRFRRHSAGTTGALRFFNAFAIDPEKKGKQHQKGIKVSPKNRK